MTERARLILVAVLAAAAGLALGFFGGVRAGAVLNDLAGAASEAMILTADLTDLRKGSTEVAISGLEARLDGAVLAYGEFQDVRGLAWVLYPMLNERRLRTYDGYMRRVAQYRQAYPRVASQGEAGSEVRQILRRHEK